MRQLTGAPRPSSNPLSYSRHPSHLSRYGRSKFETYHKSDTHIGSVTPSVEEAIAAQLAHDTSRDAATPAPLGRPIPADRKCGAAGDTADAAASQATRSASNAHQHDHAEHALRQQRCAVAAVRMRIEAHKADLERQERARAAASRDRASRRMTAAETKRTNRIARLDDARKVRREFTRGARTVDRPRRRLAIC